MDRYVVVLHFGDKKEEREYTGYSILEIISHVHLDGYDISGIVKIEYIYDE